MKVLEKELEIIISILAVINNLIAISFTALIIVVAVKFTIAGPDYDKALNYIAILLGLMLGLWLYLHQNYTLKIRNL